MAHFFNYYRCIVTILLLSFPFMTGNAANYLCFTAEVQESKVQYINYGNNAPNMEYSTDEGETWNQWDPNEYVLMPNIGDKIYVRGNNPTGFNHGTFEFNKVSSAIDYTSFMIAGIVSASGSVMSLIDGEGTTNVIPCDYCFASLFCNCTGLIKAPLLPATTLTNHCYESMFHNCNSLKQAPELPATELADYCYKSMFMLCNELIQMPELPAMTMKKNCYESMFYFCFSLAEATELPATTMADHCYEKMFNYCPLIEAPNLPATKLADYCYAEMFAYCDQLVHAPELPAITMKEHCYESMFLMCRSLEKTPELPADRLADYCYTKMFAGCSSITEAPELPAYEMKVACYQYMFNGCVKLVQAPELSSTNLAQDCYSGMFSYCESLNYIKVGLKTLEDVTDMTKDWVSDVNGPGVFIFPCGSRYDKHGASEVPINFKIIGSPVVIFQNPDSTKLYSDTIDCGDTPVYRGIDPPSAGEGTVFLGWDKELTAIDEPDIYYFTAMYENMGDLATTNTLCFTAKSEDVLLSIKNIGGNNPNVEYSRNGGVTWTTLKEGDVLEIPQGEKIHIKGSNPDGFSHGADKYTRFETSGKISVSGDVMSLIDGEGTSTEIPNEYCFAHLFENTTIIHSPTVSATTLKGSCYDHMFARCEGLRRIPELPAEKMYTSCYSHMFEGCIAIDSIPQLPATEMAPYCYEYMFRGCVNIWDITEILPAMQLAVGCYKGMFYGCESLTFSLQLPATQLADSCYAYMYYGCSSMMNSAWLPAEKLADYCYLSMYENTGILSCSLMEARELAESCCEKMFKNCKDLKSSPILHATELKDSCYKEMFYGCVHLDRVEVEILTLDNDVDATKNWMKDVNESGVFIFPCESKYDKHGVSEVPDNFTIISFPLFIYLNADGTELWRDTTDCEREPVYGGEEPTYGEGMVFVGWDIQSFIPRSGGTYYFKAQYEKEEDIVHGPWLCFKAEEAGSKIWYTNQGENQPDLLYSMDGGITWLPMEPLSATSPDNALTLTHEGAKVYIKGNNPGGFSHSASDISYFGMSGRIAASGSVMSLIDTAGYATEIPCAHCFDSLFAGCEALTQAPKLPATQLTDYCYRNMFTHCTNLTEAPLLIAEEAAEGCYSSMFSYCEKLEAVAGLANYSLKKRCYESMYLECSSLEEGYFELYSTELEESCYQGMFKDCINLKRAPILRASELVDHCYANMFEGCSSLNYIRVNHMTLDNNVDATKDWVKGVDSTGLFIFPCGSKYDKHGISEVPDKFIIQSSPIVVFQNPDGSELWRDTINCSTAPEYKGKEPTFGEGKVFLGWDKRLEVITEPTVHYYTAIYNTPAEMDMNKILCFTAEEANSQVWYTDNANCHPNLQYSTDGGQTWTNFDADKKITLPNKGDKVYVSGININGFVSTTGDLGNINFGMSGQIAASGSVMSLIDGTAETSVIPSNRCFHMLFANCEALTQAPELPATTLTESCYNNMFYGCTNLTEAPALPATKLESDCYSSMFSRCTSLTKAPELPAMDLAYACYQRMFSECTSLTTPPKLPATNLEISCYQEMFASSGLASAPVLPATKMTNQCYRGMFYQCLNLKKAPTLPSTELELGCYTAMFYGCMNMTDAPELPAMELKPHCYHGMFAACTTLVSAPELPAKQLQEGCYEEMFRYCMNLNYISVGVLTLDHNPSATANWVEMVDGPGTFIFPCGSRYNKHGVSEVPNNFTIISSPVVIFQNQDNTELWRDTIDCRTVPHYEGKEPSIGDGYIFAGWDKELTVLPIPDVYYFTAQYKKIEPYLEQDSVVFACDSFLLDGKRLTTDTTWTDTLTGERLVINYHLLLSHPTERDSSISAHESFTYKGVTYTENAEWSDTLLSTFGCDSIVNYHLVIDGTSPTPVAHKDTSACDVLVFKNITYSESTTWNDTLQSISGGDSIIVYHMTIHKSVTKDSTITAEESFTWEGTTYTENASWTETLQTVFGCDSVINYHLKITGGTTIPATFTEKDTSACDVLVFKDITYSENATWNDTLQAISGGDSIIVYHLTIHKSVTKDSTIVAEGSYKWKGTTYTEDAFWSDTMQTIYGCDSIVNYRLIVNEEKDPLQLTVEDELILVLPGGSTQVVYELTGNEGARYEVRHNGQTISSGDVTNDSTFSLTCPPSLDPGIYTATLTMYDGEGTKAEKEFTFNVMRPDDKQKSFYVKVWNDVVICRNGDGQFLTFQWYKGRKKCENATMQYFNDLNLLDGEYMVYVTDKNGKSYFIEPMTYTPIKADYTITAEPNVVKKSEEFTVTVTGVDTGNLSNARIVVYSANGTVENILNEVKEENTMRLKSGEYIIILTVNDGKNADCKVLVK